MNIWIAILLSSAGASLLGSVVLWMLISVWPGSTAGFSGFLYVSMVVLSSIVVSISASVITLCAKSYVEHVRGFSTAPAVTTTAVGGAVLYFAINFIIMAASNNKGILEKFFVTGGFVFPICVGAIYGACFGFILTRLR